MAYTYELKYGGFARLITCDDSIPIGKKISLQKFPDDKTKNDEYSTWVVDDRKDEMRETWPNKLSPVVVLTLKSLDPPPTAVDDVYRQEG